MAMESHKTMRGIRPILRTACLFLAAANVIDGIARATSDTMHARCADRNMRLPDTDAFRPWEAQKLMRK